jgi:hypothetical protein
VVAISKDDEQQRAGICANSNRGGSRKLFDQLAQTVIQSQYVVKEEEEGED